jgi:hypothetical protein
MNHLPLEPLACLEVWPLGQVQLVLLSVVAQALLSNFLCAGLFPSTCSGDVDDSYQWDIQTFEGWTWYWEPS